MAKKVDSIRDLDTAELMNRERDSREQMFRLRFQLAMGQTDGIKKFRQLKKDRARMLTVVRERELHPELAPAPVTKKKGKK